MENQTAYTYTVQNNTTGASFKEDICDIFLDVSLWIAVISFVINMFNIIAILPSNLCSKMCYRLVVNLSLSDALLDLVMIVYFGTKKAGIIWSTVSFYAIGAVFDICSLVSLWTLIAMSFDLFMLMIHPLKYSMLIDVTAFRAIIVFIWIISTVPYISLDIVIAACRKTPNISLVDAVVSDNYRSSCINSFCALLGFIIILILYITIFRDIYSLKKRLKTESVSMRKSAMTISLVVLAYFVCYMPLWMFVFVEIIVDTDLSDDARGFILECLAYLLHVVNTLCDPVIYAFRIPIIRAVYFHALLKLKRLFK